MKQQIMKQSSPTALDVTTAANNQFGIDQGKTEPDSRGLVQSRTIFLLMTVIHVSLMHAAYFILVETFSFPEILRVPAEDMLAAFQAHAELNRGAYYLFTLSGFSFILVHIFLYHSFGRHSSIAAAGRTLAVIAGLLQSLGFGRWVFLVPWIADVTLTHPEQSDTAVLILEAFHLYAGVLAGENLAFLAHGIAGILFCVHMLRDHSVPRFFAVSGIPVHAGIGLYSLEQFGGSFAALGPLNVVFQVFWLLWLLSTAVYLYRGGRQLALIQPGKWGYCSMVVLLIAMLAAALA
ncbi:MAG: DUF4386 domain-containing protein [Leptospiraceae bacterium]|nr:DUF4386 domain-containing protein [Leptospiraceae bacterium]